MMEYISGSMTLKVRMGKDGEKKFELVDRDQQCQNKYGSPKLRPVRVHEWGVAGTSKPPSTPKAAKASSKLPTVSPCSPRMQRLYEVPN